MNNKNRILKEYQDFDKNAETSGIKVCMMENDCSHWKGLIQGPVTPPSLFLGRHRLPRRPVPN